MEKSKNKTFNNFDFENSKFKTTDKPYLFTPHPEEIKNSKNNKKNILLIFKSIINKFIYKINYSLNRIIKNPYEIKIGNRFILIRYFIIGEKSFHLNLPIKTYPYITFDEFINEYKSNFYLVPTNFDYGKDFNGKLLPIKEACDLYKKYKN